MKVVERTDADRIACEDEPLVVGIEDGDREVAVEVRGKPVVPRLVRREHARRIADGAGLPQRQRIQNLLAVVEAAVEHEHCARACLPGDNRLVLPLLFGGDPKMLACQSHRAGNPMPFAVAAAMTERPAHRRQHVRGHRTSVKIPRPRDAAHAETQAVYFVSSVASFAQFPALAPFLAGATSRWPDLRISADDLMAICDAEELSPLVHHRLAGSSACGEWPDALREALAERARAHAGEELLRGAETRMVVDALASADVLPVLIKGTPLAYTVYDAPVLRARSDTDLLIASTDVDCAREVMRSLGYVTTVHCSDLFSQFEVQKVDRFGVPHAFDVHWSISTQPVFAELLTYDELLARAVPVPALGDAAVTPRLIDALLLACVHPVMHHYNVERVLWIYDVHLLAARLSPDELEELARLARTKKVAGICAHQLRLAQTVFGSSVPEAVYASLTLRRRVGTLGCVPGDRPQVARRADRERARPPVGWRSRAPAPRGAVPEPAVHARLRTACTAKQWGRGCCPRSTCTATRAASGRLSRDRNEDTHGRAFAW